MRIESINHRTRLSDLDNELLFRIIDSIPLYDILRKLIFTRYKYNILIKHEALICAIDSGYDQLLKEILQFSPDHDLVKTAISQCDDDQVLGQVAVGVNEYLPLSRQFVIQKLALQKIKDNLIFLKVAEQILETEELYHIFHKIQNKQSIRSIPSFYIRLIPVILKKIPTNEVKEEFSKSQKYSKEIIKEVSKQFNSMIYT